MRLWSLAVAALFLSSVVHAQAFGVKMGARVSDYGGRRVEPNNPYHFEVRVPRPNDEFESYTATATPETGICQVSGIGVTHRNDDYGSRTRAAFSGLRQALRERYGPSRDYDFLRVGALWDEPREWVWSIYKKERTMSSFWLPDKGAALPIGVSAIGLHVKSVDPTSGAYVTLTYEFGNLDRCLAIVKNERNSGL